MKLTHWTNKENVNRVINKEFKLDFKKHGGFSKPQGVWISVDNAWEDWLDGNWDSWLNGKECLDVKLSKDINLFIIESKEQFLKKFKEVTGEDFNFLTYITIKLFHDKLKEEFDGMFLKSEPFYTHRLDLDFMYFYTWDCESMCIWNLDKIQFKQVEGGKK